MKTSCVLCLLFIFLLNQYKSIGQINFVQHASGDLHFLLIPVRWIIPENSDIQQVVNSDLDASTKKLIHNQQNRSDGSSAIQIHETKTIDLGSAYSLDINPDMNFEKVFIADSEDKINLELWMIDMKRKSIDPTATENQIILEGWMLRPSEWLK